MERFEGFSEECVDFLVQLRANNDRGWFKRNRDLYDRAVLEPARAFVVEMGEKLRDMARGIRAVPSVDRSIFRIHRDTRFSKDKSPYKTHLGIWLWEGGGKRMESSGFYFHLEPPNLMLGVGMYMFERKALASYRAAVADDTLGPRLVQAIERLTAAGPYELGGIRYKRTPRGFSPDHERAELLLHSGLYAGEETRIPVELHGRELLDYCMSRYQDMFPLHRWLVGLPAKP